MKVVRTFRSAEGRASRLARLQNERGKPLSTVRIYKVAELLGTTSQEVTALLKRDHGIEVKSASSTIEEIVARQFVERLAKQRQVTLPTGDIFAETPAPKGGVKKPGLVKKGAEPQKPAAPALPPPRLVKAAKPSVAPAPAADAEPREIETPEPEPIEAPQPIAEVHVPEPIAVVEPIVVEPI